MKTTTLKIRSSQEMEEIQNEIAELSAKPKKKSSSKEIALKSLLASYVVIMVLALTIGYNSKQSKKKYAQNNQSEVKRHLALVLE